MTEGAPKAKARTVHLLGIIAIVLCVVIIAVMLLVRHRSVLSEQQARQREISSGARVQVVVAKQGPTLRSLTISGETRPFVTATLYAKVSGYLKEIRVDKGDRVRQGDLVARIDSPELESQYQAALSEAMNKRRFAKRELILVRDGIISKQEADDAVAAAKSAEANAAALRAQKQYQIIAAPFDGVVTARFADPGALVQSAATGQTAALPVVTVSRIDRLRVYVYLDQKSAGQVKIGDEGVVADAAKPAVKLSARVSRISRELDPRSRTMLCELDLPNPDQRLIAGSFVDVTLTVASPLYVELPTTAVYTSEEKSYVAIVGSDNRVRFREVRMADSNGKVVKLSEGVRPGERLALTPGTGLREGELVQPMPESGAALAQAQ